MSAFEKEVHTWQSPFCISSSQSLFFPVPVQHFYVFHSAGGGKHQAHRICCSWSSEDLTFGLK